MKPRQQFFKPKEKKTQDTNLKEFIKKIERDEILLISDEPYMKFEIPFKDCSDMKPLRIPKL